MKAVCSKCNVEKEFDSEEKYGVLIRQQLQTGQNSFKICDCPSFLSLYYPEKKDWEDLFTNIKIEF